MQTLELPQTKSSSNLETFERLFPPALVLLCGVVFFYGLGSLPFIGPDEPRYAEVAREMHRSGDWITTRLGGIHWFEKPALTYWLSAIGFKLFGETEFAARFGIAVLATLGVLLVYVFGKRVHSARFGYLSAAALTTCGLWPGFARGATFDLPLSVTMALALCSFFVWERHEREAGKNRLWWVFCFALGLAVLAKGLVGIVLPGAIIGLYLLLTRNLKAVLNPKLLFVGALLFLATAATWYAPVMARHGREFIDEFFIGHHFQRYVSNKYKHPQPFYFFFFVVLLGSFPWSLVLASSAWRTLKQRKALLSDRLQVFLWLWLLIPVLFFSISGSKLPGYILPVFPAAALLIGRELEKAWDEGSGFKLANLIGPTCVLPIIVAVGINVFVRAEMGFPRAVVVPLALTLIFIGLVCIVLLVFRNGRITTLAMPFGLALVVIVATHTVFPTLGNQESLRELAQLAVRHAAPDERLIFFVNADHSFDYYATALPLRDTKSELVTMTSADNIALLIAGGKSRSLLIASPRRWEEGITKSDKLTTEKLGEQRLIGKCSPDCDWVLLRARRKE